MVDPVFNNVGGEERFWFCPEGGQFGLNLGRHVSGWQNYKVQDAFSSQAFQLVASDRRCITMRSRMSLVNAYGTAFLLEVIRTVRILDACPYALGQENVDFVAFESENLVQNVGSKPITKEFG